MDQDVVHFAGGPVDQSVGKVAHVVARVRALVDSGVLRDGDRVPSTRAMAAELGVARGTVVAAYDQLDGEGYIRTRQGAAAVVVGGGGAGTVPSAEGSRATGGGGRATPVGGPATGRGGRATLAGDRASGDGSTTAPPAIRRVPHPGTAVLDARPGIPAVTAISQRDWRAAWRAAADAPLRNGLSDPLGLPELRTQIAAQLGLTRGFSPDPERVVVTAGTSDAISVVTEGLRTLLGRSPRVAVEDPGYPTGRRAVTSAGGTVLGVPVGADGLDLDALAALPPVDAVMVTPTHQYPLGSVMPVARRRSLLDWATRTGTLVLEDDYDSEFRHRGSPVPALAALDRAGSVLHLGGFSKTFDPRLRCSWIVLPAAEDDRSAAVLAARRARGPVVAEPVQVAVAHLLRSGALRRHLGRVRRDAAHRREQVLARVGASGDAGLEARALDGGLHAVVTWPGPATGHAVVDRMAALGVLVAALDDYGVRPGSLPTGVVLGYGALTSIELDRVLGLLVSAIAAG
ncbi:GntR family transcriptional regulator/MocR family aminotransferase [Curtobacterium luteum]|uniref:GntR family transcriptional regulator/MocR family aminotransferase n=1 Tax=Curtobacterium luteum TaxID=33881 RepID=A0ABS2RQQ5_9MICO|nr:PLP-dependent aminotransferase family protein [Curtobacterium luteum]MBM7801083.1 GntR family transcriptional regulator/MocR family aminotransferase [Curtobacterium luteum]NUU50587.1 PLP-dependent aminotransferase family protein [Curtobacterium luteum]